MTAPAHPEDTREDAELALLAAAQDPRVAGLSGHPCAVALTHVLAEHGWLLAPSADVLSGHAEYVETQTAGRFRPLTWRQVAERQGEELRHLRAFRGILLDLDRNANGRHEGDVDSGDPSGVSQGNPLLPAGTVIGYTIGGNRRPIVMPARADRHRPEAWTPEPE